MMFGTWDDWGNWGHGFFGMGLGMLLFWGLLVGGVFVLIRWLSGDRSRGPSTQQPESALDILAQRYARSEIDRAEFEQKRRDLSGS